MKGIIYQFKNIRRDRLCILTFLLPIIAGIAVHLMSDINFSSLAELSFGVLENNLSQETIEWLQEKGDVKVYTNMKALEQAVNNPSDQMTGVLRYGKEDIRTIRSGDEMQMAAAIADRLPQIFASRETMNIYSQNVVPVRQSHDFLRSLLVVITLVTAMFMGCTFNAMSMINEKEDGIIFINEVLPMSNAQYMAQKMVLGFAGGILSTLAAAIICMRIPDSQIVLLILLVVLSAFIAALAGVFIGHFSNGLMAGIAYIKIMLIIFLAPPIFFYLYFSEESAARALSYVLPSSASFYGLMDLMGGRTRNMAVNLIVLTVHCAVWFIFYLLLSRRKRKTF